MFSTSTFTTMSSGFFDVQAQRAAPSTNNKIFFIFLFRLIIFRKFPPARRPAIRRGR